MSDNIQHIDVDSDEFIDAPRALRDYVKQLKQANTRITEERDTLKSQVTATVLTDVLAGYKNPERVKRDLLADKIDPLDTEAVDKWLAANGDDYARGQAPATPNTDPALDEEAAAHQRLNSTELRSPADMAKQEAVFQQITPDMTGADLVKLYRQNGL